MGPRCEVKKGNSNQSIMYLNGFSLKAVLLTYNIDISQLQPSPTFAYT